MAYQTFTHQIWWVMVCYDLAHQIRCAKHTFSGWCDIPPMVCCSFGGHSTPQFLQCMIKARIRCCSCRVENILTLGKLLSLWFCFLLHSILFLISQTSYRTYKIISSYEFARPVMGTIFLVYVGMSYACRMSN